MELLNFNDFSLNEAKTSWNGRFENLNKILSYNYELMKDSDKKLKDTIFGAYYRYFNDGDVNAFPKGILNKIGVPADVIADLGSEMRADIRYSNARAIRNKQYSSVNNSTTAKMYEKAMEEAIKYVFKYFTVKYPEFFKSEGRQKTYDQWKSELMKYATEKPSELSTYWVSEFGKQFGVDELKQYNPYSPENKDKEDRHTITDTKTIVKIIELMLNSIKKDKPVNESILNEDKNYYIDKGYITDDSILNKEDLFKNLNENLSKAFNEFNTKHKLDIPNPSISIEDGKRGSYIILNSDDIIGSDLGIFKNCMADAYFNFFSGTEIKYTTVEEEFMFMPYIWCTLNIGYNSIKGGSNGLNYHIDGKNDDIFYYILDREFSTEHTK